MKRRNPEMLALGQGRELSGAKEYKAYEERQMEKIANMFAKALKAQTADDFTVVNDKLLRLNLGRPSNIVGGEAENSFYKKLKSSAGKAANAEGIHGEAQREGIEWFERLESSVRQLSEYVREQWKNNPDLLLATSRMLDARYGIDLIEIATMFDREANKLIIDLNLIQAKAKRGGLRAEDIRSLPEKYEERVMEGAEQIRENQALLLATFGNPEVETPDISEADFVEAVTGDVARMAEIQSRAEAPNAYEEYLKRKASAESWNAYVDAFGEGDRMALPEIELGDIRTTYLVQTPEGNRLFTREEAESYT